VSTEIARLEDQLRWTFEGKAWHGPSVLEAVAGVTPEQAAARPIAGAHTIHELVLHLSGTYRLVLRRLKGDGTQLAPEEDWPATSSASWLDAVGTLKKLHAELVQAVAAFPEARLDQPIVPESPYPAYTQFIGMTHHNLYHAGQIVLLKRALS
jgi:uncharacterized damage-inducible protein DinB